MYIKIKRGIDLILALGLLIIFGIPMCIIAICIKLEDGGQVIYKSKRMGIVEILMELSKAVCLLM